MASVGKDGKLKVVAVVTDDASAAKLARKLLQDELGYKHVLEFRWVACLGCDSLACRAGQGGTVLHGSAAQFNAAQRSAVQCSAAQRSAGLGSAAWCSRAAGFAKKVIRYMTNIAARCPCM